MNPKTQLSWLLREKNIEILEAIGTSKDLKNFSKTISKKVNRPTVYTAKIIDNLVKKGILKRIRAKNKRIKPVTLTPKGLKTYDLITKVKTGLKESYTRSI